LGNICEKIALELKSQYVIGYESSNTNKDGKYRKIRVRTTPPAGMTKINVRAREGYYGAAN
jgi:Ca-activated chloride channel homolog